MKHLRIFDTRQDGTPCLTAYDEFPTRDHAIAELWAYARFKANALEVRWLWDGDAFVSDRSLIGKAEPGRLRALIDQAAADMEAAHIDAAGEKAAMWRECRP
jgi:hypothetical protein